MQVGLFFQDLKSSGHVQLCHVLLHNTYPHSKFSGINECDDSQIHKCAQICTDTPTSYYCSCNAGYKLMPDGKACEDIDECLTTPAVCSQMCENTVGSYLCKCAPGYIREPDGRSCRQNSGVDPYLLYTNRYYIRKMNTDGSQMSIFLQGLDSVVALDFDDSEKMLYWLDTGTSRKIERMRFDGTGRETLVDELEGGEGLAVDWVSRYETKIHGLFFLKKNTFVVLLSKLIQQLLRQVALGHVCLSWLQEVVLDGFILWLNQRHGAQRSLPEETAVRQVHGWKFLLHHQQSAGCGSQPTIWVLIHAHTHRHSHTHTHVSRNI